MYRCKRICIWSIFIIILFLYSLKIVKYQIERPTVVMFFKYLISCDWLSSDFYHLWFGTEPVPYDNSILYGTSIQQTELFKIFAERHNGFSEEDSHSHGLCRARTCGEALPDLYRLVILFTLSILVGGECVSEMQCCGSGSGAFLIHGSGIRNSFFLVWELNDNYLVKSYLRQFFVKRPKFFPSQVKN